MKFTGYPVFTNKALANTLASQWRPWLALGDARLALAAHLMRARERDERVERQGGEPHRSIHLPKREQHDAAIGARDLTDARAAAAAAAAAADAASENAAGPRLNDVTELMDEVRRMVAAPAPLPARPPAACSDGEWSSAGDRSPWCRRSRRSLSARGSVRWCAP